jgi:L,D-transpeptidase YbiS
VAVVAVVPRSRVARVVVAAVVVVAALVAWGTGYVYRPLTAGDGALASAEPVTASAAKLRAERDKLAVSLRKKTPAVPYLVVDQTNNRLYLKRGGETVLSAVCSAGSGMILHEGKGGRSWIFDTPRGAFKVRNKIENPVWKKPDWAFVEENEPIPANPADRMEYGSLGEYALYLGDGYMIHGTLYERLLGRSVTHGCIRLGRDDLRQVYREAQLGTPVFIF